MEQKCERNCSRPDLKRRSGKHLNKDLQRFGSKLGAGYLKRKADAERTLVLEKLCKELPGLLISRHNMPCAEKRHHAA